MIDSFAGPLWDRAAGLWKRLIEPTASIQDADTRRLRLLASLLLAATIAVLLLAPVPLLVNRLPPPQDPQFIATCLSVVCLFAAYQLARHGYYKCANAVSIGYGTIAILVAAVIVGGQSGVNGLYYLLTVFVFACLFLSFRVTLGVLAAQVVGMLILVASGRLPSGEIFNGPLVFDIFLGGIILLVTRHWHMEREERHARLLEQEEHYRLISETISDYAFSFWVQPDGSLKLDWITDRSYMRTTGYSPNEILNGSTSAFVPEEQPAVQEEWRSTLAGEPSEGEHRAIIKDGSERWFHIYRQPIWDAAHTRVVRVYGVVQDVTARKQAEIALRESEDRYRQISEMISDYTFSYAVDADGEIHMEWATDSIVNVTGYTVSETRKLVQPNTMALYHPDSQAQVTADVKKTLTNVTVNGEYQILTKSGETRWVHVSRRPVWDPSEQRVVRYYAVSKDVTERRLAEEARRETEERYRVISELISDFAYSCVVDSNGELSFEWVTESVSRVTGFTQDEFKAHLYQIFHPDDVPVAQADVAKVLNGTPVGNEYRMVTHSGEHRWIWIYRQPIWNEAHDRVIRFYAVVQDITERKQAELALRESEDRYRMISEMISDYAFSMRIDVDGRILMEWVTDSVSRVTGYAPEETWGVPQFKLYHPDDEELSRQDVQRVLRGEVTDSEYRIITKAGELRWLRMFRRPIWDDAERRVVRFYGVAQDVTEIKQAEAQKMRLALEQERMTMVNQFVRAFSHDVRTSLATIETSRYLIERLMKEHSSPALQTQLNKIHHSVNHLAEQLNNLFMVSSLSDPNPIPCQFNRLIESLIAEHSFRAKQKKQNLRFEPDSRLGVTAADEVKLRLAVQHLLLNALAHTGEGGEIVLRTRQGDQDVSIEVQDNGSGIPPEILEHIFEPFYKADEARSLGGGGLGLGLSIVKMIVEAHGGRISVVSQPGEGSTFTIKLPMRVRNTSASERPALLT